MIEHTHVEFWMFKDMFSMINSLLFETLILFLQVHIVASTTTISMLVDPQCLLVHCANLPCFSRIFASLELGENHGNSPI